MPSLKQLTCSIELGSTHTKVAEYGKDYGDGHVTSYIAVPSEEVNFSIHLTSHGYIAPGLAMFVYMDGQYQCNRNRRGLKVPGKGVRDEQVEVDLRVRQKESKQADGSFLGRDWTFAGLNLVSADKVEETDEVFLDNLGTIEVIVLRCKDAPLPPPESASRESSSRPTSKPSSRRTSTQQEQKVPSKPPSSSHRHKEPSNKEKAPSKPPSAKPATAKESSVGGMFGLFDGASDERDHDGINPKPYWNDWNKRPSIPSSRPARNLYIVPEEPLPLVPKQAARAKHVEHQVKTGKGAQYLHLCARPEYLDSMKQPYAVFTFKYRSKRVIEKKFKIEIKEEGKALKAKLADMSKEELAAEVFKLKMAQESSKYKKDKAPSAAKSQEMPTASKPPSAAKSKTATAPACDAQPAANEWNAEPTTNEWNAEPATNDWPAAAETKPASKAPSKAVSKTASQKANQAPGSYPVSHSSHYTAAASHHHSSSNAAKSATKKSTSRKSTKEEAAVAGAEESGDQAAAGGEAGWDQPQQDATWDQGGAAADVQWGPLHIAITIIGVAIAIAVSIAAYYWIKTYVLKAIAFILLLKSWIMAPFAWTKSLWSSLTDFHWLFSAFAGVFAGIKRPLLAIMEYGSKVVGSKLRFLDLDAWEMVKWPEWFVWRGGVPEVVKDGFHVFVPDGVQAVEEVVEDI
ncbi:hypothetical protein E4T48_05104 [Aureobasidium sp. EXF-10727]|nr:hypothetical protein E4T48_05104 [Aureobasidium sp. EXF-10727]